MGHEDPTHQSLFHQHRPGYRLMAGIGATEEEGMSQDQHAKLYQGSGQDWEGEPVIISDQPRRAENILQAGIDALLMNAALRDSPQRGERSAPKAAAILTAWTDEEWTAIDVWKCLVAVKMAREAQGKIHIDDYIDAAAYFALLGEECSRL